MGLISFWLNLPVWLVFATLAFGAVATTAIIYALSFGPRTRGFMTSFAGIAPPLFGSLAVLFGLLLGFVANDAWDRNRQAGRAVLGERDGLLAIHQLSIATVSDMSAIRTALRHYVKTVIEDEWPRMAGGEGSAATGRALGGLLHQLADPKISQEAGQVAHTMMMDLVLKVRAARSDRLALVEQRSDQFKWMAVLILAFVTQLTLGLTHLEKPRAQLAALLLFSTAAASALGLVAIRDRPFDGALRMTPHLMEEALAVMLKECGPSCPTDTSAAAQDGAGSRPSPEGLPHFGEPRR